MQLATHLPLYSVYHSCKSGNCRYTEHCNLFQMGHPDKAQSEAEQRMLIVHAPCSQEQDVCTLSSLMLPDHKSQNGNQMCCLVSQHGQLLEVQHFKTMYSAWLIQQQIISDGGVFLATPLDPLFVLLPVLDRGQEQGSKEEVGVFCSFDDLCDSICDTLCTEAGQRAAVQQVLASTQPSLACICDTKQLDEDLYYRPSRCRALAWLSLKLCRCKDALAAQLAGLDPAAQDAYALSFLSEYLSPRWCSLLSSHLQIDTAAATTAPAARPKEAHGGPADKKVKLDPKEIARLQARKRAEEEKKAKLAKEAAGMKTISSFFAKKV